MRPLLILALCAVVGFAGCQSKAPESDSTPPGLHLSFWEEDESGRQSPQRTIFPGEQATIPGEWLEKRKAEIRVVGDDDEGVREVEVWGTAMGKCVARDSNNPSQVYVAPQPLPASFPKQTENAGQGYVKSYMVFHLDDLMIDASCGMKQYQGMAKPEEFTMKSGKWTIYAHAENCCGGEINGTFVLDIT